MHLCKRYILKVMLCLVYKYSGKEDNDMKKLGKRTTGSINSISTYGYCACFSQSMTYYWGERLENNM